GRQLVAKALASPCRHHAEHVAATQDSLDHLALPGAEPLQPEPVAERVFQVDRAFGKAHGPQSLTPLRWEFIIGMRGPGGQVATRRAGERETCSLIRVR